MFTSLSKNLEAHNISLTKEVGNNSPKYLRKNISVGPKPLRVDFSRCYEFMENMASDIIMSALYNPNAPIITFDCFHPSPVLLSHM